MHQHPIGLLAVDGIDGYDVPNFAVTQLTNGNVVVTWERSGAYGAPMDQPLYAVIDVSASQTPVVLDLNHDGVIGYSHVTMDVNGDGVQDQTAWTDAHDGVLVWDKLADGVVHDKSQYAFSQYAGQTGLQGLAAAFDTNHDGSFDSLDTLFKQFAVWQDANQNGVSDAGEVKSLAALGITAIHLQSDGVVRAPAEGVVEFGQTTATLADGTTVLVADAQFTYAEAPRTLYLV